MDYESCKKSASDAYSNKEFKKAIKFYQLAGQYADQKQIGILYANLSAVYFQDRQYENSEYCINAISEKVFGQLDTKIQNKLQNRLAKVQEILESKIAEEKKVTLLDDFASTNFSIKHSKSSGRDLIYKYSISPGDILGQERPAILVIVNQLENGKELRCSYSGKKLIAPIYHNGSFYFDEMNKEKDEIYNQNFKEFEFTELKGSFGTITGMLGLKCLNRCTQNILKICI